MKKTETKKMIMCALFSALISIGAFIHIPIAAVPFTLQTVFVILCGYILGPKYAAVSTSVYLLSGLIGLPVFTGGGGLSYLLHPTFGYIIGFIAGAVLTGYLSHKYTSPTFCRLILSGFVGIAVIYIIGTLYYFLINHLYLGIDIKLHALLTCCIFTTLPKDIIMTVLAAFIAKRLYPFFRKI